MLGSFSSLHLALEGDRRSLPLSSGALARGLAELHTGGLEMENLILLPGGKRLVVSWWVGGTQGWAVVLLESGEVPT